MTGNKNKFQEAQLILMEYDLELEMENTKIPEIQSNDIEIIAKTSVIEAKKRVSGSIIVEDAGLFIKKLNGFPGPYSSYVQKTLGCKGILKLLEGVEERTAEFKSAVAFIKDTATPKVKIFHGVINGEISKEMRGKQGFGFDPIFIPNQLDRTFGEIRVKEKSKYSHRAMALKGFASWLNANT